MPLFSGPYSAFVNPGELYVGTGASAGELLEPGSMGKVLTMGATFPEWDTPGGSSITTVEASLGADVPLPASTDTTILTTGSIFSSGGSIFIFTATVYCTAAAGGSFEVIGPNGNAVLIGGVASAVLLGPGSVSWTGMYDFVGNDNLRIKATAGLGGGTAKQFDPTYGLAATGIVAFRVA